MTTEYQYDPTPSTRPAVANFGPLPEGDYDFTVIPNDFSDSNKPVLNKNSRWVLNIKLAVGPQKNHIFYSPWSGTDRNGEKRDQIAEFLRAVGKAPAPGKDPDWDNMIGARGKVHLKCETETYAQSKMFGKEVNKVAYVLAPKSVNAGESKRETVSAPLKPQHAFDPDLDAAPDDIPF